MVIGHNLYETTATKIKVKMRERENEKKTHTRTHIFFHFQNAWHLVGIVNRHARGM